MAKIKAFKDKYNGVIPRLLLLCKYVGTQRKDSSLVRFFNSRELPFPGLLTLKW